MKGISARWLVAGASAFWLGWGGGQLINHRAADTAGMKDAAKPLGSALTSPGVESRDATIDQPELAERIQFLQTLTTTELGDLPALVGQLVADLDRNGTYRELGNAIDRWVELDPAGGFAFCVAALSDGGGKFPISLFARRWARVDPDAAVEACQAAAPDSLTSIAEELANQRPADYFRLLIGGSGNDYLAEASQRLAREDPQAMLAFLPQLDETLRDGVSADLACGWARKDPEAAIVWVRELDEGAIRQRAFRALAFGLVDSDPQRAAEIYLEGGIDDGREAIHNTVAFGEYTGQNFGWGEIAKRLASSDPVAAYRWAQHFTDGRTPGELVTTCAPASASATIDYFRALPPEAFVAGTTINPPYEWRPADVVEGMARITEITDPNARETALAWLLAADVGNDPQAAIATAMDAIGTPASRAPILEQALAAWAASDPPAASAWLAGLGAGSDRDAGIRGLLQASRLGDPDAALEWAQQISDGEARQGQLSFILSGQPRRWALDALESLGLDDAERSEIERMAQLNLASE